MAGFFICLQEARLESDMEKHFETLMNVFMKSFFFSGEIKTQPRKPEKARYSHSDKKSSAILEQAQ